MPTLLWLLPDVTNRAPESSCGSWPDPSGWFMHGHLWISTRLASARTAFKESKRARLTRERDQRSCCYLVLTLCETYWQTRFWCGCDCVQQNPDLASGLFCWRDAAAEPGLACWLLASDRAMVSVGKSDVSSCLSVSLLSNKVLSHGCMYLSGCYFYPVHSSEYPLISKVYLVELSQT